MTKPAPSIEQPKRTLIFYDEAKPTPSSEQIIELAERLAALDGYRSEVWHVTLVPPDVWDGHLEAAEKALTGV